MQQCVCCVHFRGSHPEMCDFRPWDTWCIHKMRQIDCNFLSMSDISNYAFKSRADSGVYPPIQKNIPQLWWLQNGFVMTCARSRHYHFPLLCSCTFNCISMWMGDNDSDAAVIGCELNIYNCWISYIIFFLITISLMNSFF